MTESRDTIRRFLESRELLIQESMKEDSGFRTTRRYSDLMDQFVRSVFLGAGFKEGIKDQPDNGLVILGLGSYGRREFCFGSDIDLMIVYQGKLSGRMHSVIQNALYPLWDARLDVGHSTLNIQECVRLALSDFRVLTSVMDARFILGSRFFSRLFEEAFRSRIEREKDSLLRQFLVHRDKRIERYGSEDYFMEPDIKEGLGGLRDLHFMSWMANLYLRCRNIVQISRYPAFSHFEIERLGHSRGFLLKVRNHLHVHTGRKEDRLLLSYQEKLSRGLGYEDLPHIKAPERFMKDLYLHLNRIRYGAEEFLVKAMDIIEPSPVEPISEPVEGEFQVLKGNIVLVEGRLSEKDPAIILRALNEANRPGLFLGSGLIWEAKKTITVAGRALLASKEAKKLFLELILKPRNAKITRLALEIGLITLFIPEFKKIRNLAESGYYHVETVDLHSLKTLGTIYEISTGKYDNKWPLFKKVFDDLEHPERLFLAAFLHDIGKGYRGDHSEKGAEIIRRILKRLEIDGGALNDLPFLVRHHLLLARISQQRDLSDEKTSVQVAQTIQSTDILNMLYLLTVADSFSTGPIARSDWKIILLTELFVKVSRILERGILASPDVTKEIQFKKNRILERLTSYFSREAILSLMDQISARYFLNTDVKDMEKHFRLALNMGDKNFVWELEKIEGAPVTRIILCTYDRPGLFGKIVGVLNVNNITVLAAHIFTLKNGLAFDIYEVSNPRDPYREEEIWQKILADIGLALEDNFPLDELIRKKRLGVLESDIYIKPEFKKVRIDNKISDFFTVIEVGSQARVGMLYELAKLIFSMGLDIRFAKFNNDREKMSGVFHVRDSIGQKIQEEERIEEIRKRIVNNMTMEQKA